MPVPDLVGKTISEARTLLERATSGSAELPEAAVQRCSLEGVVIADGEVPANGKAPRNSAMEVVVSKGPKPVPVPNVVGATVEDATQALDDAGFVVDVIEDEILRPTSSGGSHPADTRPTARLQPGRTVTLVVSLGPKSLVLRTSSGSPAIAATALAGKYGGSPWTSKTIGTTSGTLVYSQNPGVGVTVTYGDTITLYMV